MITSKTNGQLKKVKKLINSAKERKESGLFVVEGARLFSEVPVKLAEAVFVSEDCPAAVKKLTVDYKNVDIVEKEIFRGLSDTVTPQGVMAVVKQPKWSFTKILEEASGKNPADAPAKFLILDGVRDPGNLGTMIRTAEAAGVAAVIMSPDCVDVFNPKVIRSTMGSIFRVPIISCELLPVIKELKECGFSVYGTSLGASKSYKEVDYSKSAVVIGSEANGISDRVINATTENVIIPMEGQVESLNAAISAAILLFA